MGCGQKAVSDDEDDWDDFKLLAGINKDVNWQVYSQEARFAKAGYIDYGFTGILLVKYVNIELEFDKAKQLYQAKLNKLKEINSI